MKNADDPDYAWIGYVLLGFAPFVTAILVTFKYSFLGLLAALLFFVEPACIGWACMAIFVRLTARSCGPVCTRFLLLAGLYGVLVLVVGVVCGEGLFSLLWAFVRPDDTFNRASPRDIVSYVTISLQDGFVPAFIMGIVGGLISRFYHPTSVPDA